MRFLHLCGLLALTVTNIVFALGPIIDSDPAPGRSPGPPVNYSALSASVPGGEGEDIGKGVRPFAVPAPSHGHSTVSGNYEDTALSATSSTETPATPSSPLTVHGRNNLRSNHLANEEESPRQGLRGEKEEEEEGNPPSTPSYIVTTTKEAKEGRWSGDSEEEERFASPRNRRSSNGVTATTIGPKETIERIPVATVQGEATTDGEWQEEPEVVLFCADSDSERKERERSFFNDMNDVLVKLPETRVSVVKWSEQLKSGDEKVVSETPGSVDKRVESEKISLESIGDIQSSVAVAPLVTPNINQEVGDNKSEVNENKEQQEEKTFRDHGVPVGIAVTHEVFDSLFGLVADLEYRGK